jgi:hypothetical protein
LIPPPFLPADKLARLGREEAINEGLVKLPAAFAILLKNASNVPSPYVYARFIKPNGAFDKTYSKAILSCRFSRGA